MLKKAFKMIAVTIGIIVLSVIIGTTLFMHLHPVFGGSHSDHQIEKFEQSGHYRDGSFENLIPTTMDMGFGKIMSIMKDYWNGIPNQKPEKPLPVLALDSLTIAARSDSIARITWFGHSAFLLEIAGQKILLDPMFGDSPSPISIFGTKRFSDGLPIEIEKLPDIDAIIFSHDHYDHLDYPSILKLKEKTKRFFVPLGIKTHLVKWGVEPNKITEANWWDETGFEEIKLVCTPARHFSGRGIFNRNSTLWASWVILVGNHKIYFSGDSGYGPHFKEIGKKYGPFNFAMMECGQYDKRWENIHMLPEQTAQAAKDLDSKVMIPIHWGSFVLALHSWNDPVIRVTYAADQIDQPLLIPQIGEPINLGNPETNSKWWTLLN